MMNQLPADYDERVYAGWLGKCIGVRFGAPLENWTYEHIRDHLGELEWYAFGEGGKVFKPDDDTSVPMLFIRALEDFGDDPTAAQLGDTLLNYLGDQHGTIWWGGYGISTEHTAYVNLANGIPAPRSGSIIQNGAATAEQIGGQIFSDIWGLVAPNDPARAAALAERAASVTHDGNGIYGGRFVAALVSAAFSEADPKRLIEIGLQHIPADSEYARVIRAMVDFHRQNPTDWRAGYAHLKANFGYDRYPGVVHIIPNAGIIALGLLYGEGDFSRSIRIANMGGWDTDCNVGNVGAIMGVALGVGGIDARWREPVNDLLITAGIIGTRNILTIPQCADLFCRLGRRLNGAASEPAPRYHFRYPGSTGAFEVGGDRAIPTHRSHDTVDGVGVLRVAIRKLNKKGEARIFTRTSYRPSELSANSYGAQFTPLVAPGQTIRARVYLPPQDAPESVLAAIFVYDDYHQTYHQPQSVSLTPGWHDLTYTVPPMQDVYLSQVGVVLRVLEPIWERGSFCIAALDWDGAPSYKTTFANERPETAAISGWTRLRGFWRLEDGAYHGSGPGWCESYTGDISWSDYRLSAELVPLLGDHHRVNVRVRGALRSYAFGLAPDGRIALYKKDREYVEVASAPFAWRHGETYRLSITASGAELAASVEGAGQSAALNWTDTDHAYLTGQVGFSTGQGGHTRYLSLEVSPA
ncbi:MAG: ADP-ribosylglycohydrolase family protein [Chloroflexi bacterium]|nr:ADP-ribosylglycohydrolase family protein [Chloroflexota bacterium]